MSDPKNLSRRATIPVRDPSLPLSSNKHLLKWIQKMVILIQPDAVHWVDGSEEENDALCQQMVEGGTFIKLNEELRPGCYYAKSDPGDVARVEDRTFICSLSKDGAGPTNNWANPFEMRRKLKELFNGCMRGRTMYVLPFSMGHIGSPMSQNRRSCVSWRASACPFTRKSTPPESASYPVCIRWALRSRLVKRMSRGRATPTNTSSTSPKHAKSGAMAPVTAATPCSAKNV
jgi:Phosphoenolpyruvate carboxykinase N-terminal domain